MTYLVASIAITSVFYSVACYMSYFTASVLHKGVTYRLAMPILKAVVFILLCYTSIISDVILFNDSMYNVVIVKNGLLLLLVIASLITAKSRKGERR